MQKLILGLTLFFVSGCLPLGEPNQIVVDGEASLEFAPDTFALTASLRSRQSSSAASLKEIADNLARVRESLPNLEGLTHITIEASAAELTPIFNAECLEKSNYRSEDKCPIEGYFGSIDLNVKGSPARISGYALSLLSELGADSVRLTGYSLAEMDKAQQQALDAAVKDARSKAEKIANASGSTIGAPIRIQFGEGFPDRDYYATAYSQSTGAREVSADRIVVPETELDLDPQPIKIRAKVVAAFEID